tara:strand:+ start:237 stop:563 length:327 start_codon:yes stop_codon:yes gene_type:complete
MTNLFKALELNDNHRFDKEALTIQQLTLLKNAGFTDISWASNECASFGSDCQNYELFINLRDNNARDEFQVAYYHSDGSSTFIHSNSAPLLELAIQAIQAHKKAGEQL